MRAFLLPLILILVGSLPAFAKFTSDKEDCDDARRHIEARRDFCNQVLEHRGRDAWNLCLANLKTLPASCEQDVRPQKPRS